MHVCHMLSIYLCMHVCHMLSICLCMHVCHMLSLCLCMHVCHMLSLCLCMHVCHMLSICLCMHVCHMLSLCLCMHVSAIDTILPTSSGRKKVDKKKSEEGKKKKKKQRHCSLTIHLDCLLSIPPFLFHSFISHLPPLPPMFLHFYEPTHSLPLSSVRFVANCLGPQAHHGQDKNRSVEQKGRQDGNGDAPYDTA